MEKRVPVPWWILVTLLSLPTLPAAAQDPGNGPLLLELPSSTAAAAMGGAFQTSGTSSDALFMSPGVLHGARGFSGALQRYGSDATLLTLSAATGWWSGGVALGVRALEFGATSRDLRDLTGHPGVLQAAGPVAVGELAATVGYGRRIGPVASGVAVGYVTQRVDGEANSTFHVDVGLATEVGPLTVGLSVHDLGPELPLGEEGLPLPHRGTAAAAFRGWAVGPLDLGAAASTSLLSDGTVTGGGGIEVAYWPVVGRTFIARAGVRAVPEGPGEALSFGAAFEGDDVVLEWAYRGFGGLDGTHRIGLGFR